MQTCAHDRADLAGNGLVLSAGCGDVSAIAIFAEPESLSPREIESTGILRQLIHIVNPLAQGIVFRRQDNSKDAKCDQTVTSQASNHR
jgi:hypothetical protein